VFDLIRVYKKIHNSRNGIGTIVKKKLSQIFIFEKRKINNKLASGETKERDSDRPSQPISSASSVLWNFYQSWAPKRFNFKNNLWNLKIS
jgi:hypothetical protein